NVVKVSGSYSKPNVRFEVRATTPQGDILENSTTCDIPTENNMTWRKYGLSFVASNNSVVLLIISNVENNYGGNDLAVDNIELRDCPNNHSCSNNQSSLCPSDEPTISQHISSSSSTTTTTTIDMSKQLSCFDYLYILILLDEITTSQHIPSSEATATIDMIKSSTNALSTFIFNTNATNAAQEKETTSIKQSVGTLQTTSVTQILTENSVSLFVPKSCNDSSYIGVDCNILSGPCDMIKPCENNSTCINNNTVVHGYICLCSSGFSGIQCEFDHRPCKIHTCFNHGVCNETSDTSFHCICNNGWQGIHCESMINYCLNITCENSAICRRSLLNYACECLSENYYGRHCEFSTTKIIIYKIVSKSFAYIAIIAMTIVAMFIIIMDILTYCFGIDLTREERERFRREKRGRKWNRPVNQKLIYVNALSEPLKAPIPTIEDTTI
ncbi:unnamed protein product, partial [Adineta steineri]